MTKEQIKQLAQWLHESFPKEYKMAPYQISIDTRPAEKPDEFMIILHDEQHKLLYIIPAAAIRHILSDIDILEKKGVKELRAMEEMGFSWKHSGEEIKNYSLNRGKRK